MTNGSRIKKNLTTAMLRSEKWTQGLECSKKSWRKSRSCNRKWNSFWI